MTSFRAPAAPDRATAALFKPVKKAAPPVRIVPGKRVPGTLHLPGR